jgi:cysteine-rich repeat protein
VSGTPFDHNVSNTLIVTAYDSSGVRITTGGSTIYAKISNHWTRSLGRFECTAVSGRRIVIDSYISGVMTDKGDGTYEFSFTIERPGNLTVSLTIKTLGEVKAEWYSGGWYPNISPSKATSFQDINKDWNKQAICGLSRGFVSIIFSGTLKVPVTGTYIFSFAAHDHASFYFNEDVSSTGYSGGRTSLTVYLVEGEFYDFTFYYTQTGWYISYYYFYWQYDGQSRQVIPSQYYASPEYVSGDVTQMQSICQPGYSESTDAGGIITWVTVWGDGARAGSEVCDDSNDNSGDGCAAGWAQVETGWNWTGGTPTTPDIWTYWGNAKEEVHNEECDDGNTIDGDGCSSTCRIEAGYEWWDGSATTASFWTKWGDGKRHCSEECDDENIITKDGWSSDCKIETTIWQCTGGSKTTADVCTYCGDGLVSGDEEWDDRNYKSGDGCSFDDCKKELTHDFKYYRSPDDKKDIFTYCGDGIRYGVEECDDGNNANEDGWSSNWKIEDDWKCIYGSLRSRDYWLQWSNGYELNKDKTECVVSENKIGTKIFGILSLFLLSISVVIDTAYTMILKDKNLQAYSTLDYVQKILMLVLIGSHYPEEVLHYFRIIRVSMLSYSFFGLRDAINDKIKYSQTDQRMHLLGFISNSGIVNIIEYLLIYIFIFAIFGVCKLVKYLKQGNESSKTFIISAFILIVNKDHWILRYFVIGMNLVVLSSVSEFKKNLETDFEWSWCISYIIMLVSIWVTVFVLVYSVLKVKYRFPQVTDSSQVIESTKEKELFRGLKDSVGARFYPFLTMMQKLLLASILLSASKSRPMYSSVDPESEPISFDEKLISLVWMNSLLLM